ncbi:hypothetical protein CIRG_10294 [Coccidioides immitis RMSCC 2394]|uniref:Phosphoribosylaminoimidazole-succinocarboxamide synthase n=1 Tax=Coccidioides immitis RMSCC 2394 TaxID=404692 RepID=A0A0J6Y413_COCIT|nr:hypothetical protein CIRG_10294 [Coccidioides immitis RMSCC 2394]
MVSSGTATLKTVDRSRPQLVHTPSQQSVAASSDYYSLSDATVSSAQSRITVVRYQTPPSRTITPAENMINSAPRDQAGRQSDPQLAGSAFRAGARTDTATPTPGVDDTPYIRFAIDQLTRDEELRGQGRQGTIVSTEDYPIERIIPDEGLGYYTPPSIRRGDEPEEPEQPQQPQQEPENPPQHDPAAFFIPVDPPQERYQYPPLTAAPCILRPLLLCPLIFSCLCMIAALVFCSVWCQKYDWLWEYNGFGGSRYFVFEFLPQLLAILIVICVFVVQAAVYRVIPFSIIARTINRQRALQNLPMFPRNFLLPDLSHFQHGEPLIGACLLVIWATNFITVPLQSCLFQPKWYAGGGEAGFKWTTVQPIAWLLVAVYALLAAALVAIALRFNLGVTGLQWDPVSLADIIPMIQKSNILHDFDQAEIADRVEEFLPPRPVRLGYWKTSMRQEIFYAIGEGNAPLHRLPERSEGRNEKSRAKEMETEEVDVERQRLNDKNSFERNLHSPFIRFRWAPWFLRDTFVVAWIVIAVVLLIAFMVVSFVNQPIRNGFAPLLSTVVSSSGFSPSNFLYSFIPALIGNFFFLAWQPLDVYFRAIQPFASLSSPSGTSAESSLLLGYNSCFPVEITFVALANRHYKVAYISFVALVSLAIPVLAGGMFMAEWYSGESELRVSTHLPAFYALIAFVMLYALSYSILWPRRKRYLPHKLSTYTDLISFLYQSPLLSDKTFREPKTKVDLVTRTIVPPPGEGGTALYAFGVYHGLDGKEHLGIDRLRRPERGEMLVSPPPGGRPFSM